MVLVRYGLGARGGVGVELASIAISLLSLAKAFSDMYDRALIAERTRTPRPSDWAPEANAAASVARRAALALGGGGGDFRLLEGDSEPLQANN